MTFLHPGLLAAGLAAIAIPIIIHFLFRRRRRPVMWGAMRFLLEAYRKQRRRLQLEQLLLLLVRCLILACVGVAVGRPLLDRAGLLAGDGGRTVYLLVDNSLTSQLRDAGGQATALDRHKASAAEILESLGPSGRAGLITLGGPAAPVVAPPSSDLAAVRRLVEAIEPTDAPADVGGALRAVASAIGAEGDDVSGDALAVAILSDFREGSTPLAEPPPAALAGFDEALVLAAAPAASLADNVQIVALDPVRDVLVAGGPDGGAPQQVRVGLKRFGPGVGEAAATGVLVRLLDADGRPTDPAGARTTVRWRPGQETADATLQIRGGWGDLERGQLVLAASIDLDGLAADNVRRRPVEVRDAIRVGVVAQRRFGRGPRVDRLAPADWLRLALAPGDAGPVEVVDVEPASIDAAVLSGLDAVFVPSPDLVPSSGWARLRTFADAGGLIGLWPPAVEGVNLWTDAMSDGLGLDWRIGREPTVHDPPASITRTEAASRLLSIIQAELDDLLKPVSVERTLPIEQAGERAETPVSLTGGAPWLTIAPVGRPDADEPGRGLVVYIASAMSLDWTDLPAKPLMVPLVQELVRQGVGRAGGAASTWTAGGPIRAPGGANSIEAVGDARRLAVGPAGEPESPLRRAGVWRAIDDSGRSRGVVVVNPEARAGATDPAPPDALRQWLGAIGGTTASGEGLRVSLFEPGGAAEVFVEAGRGSPISFPLFVAALVLVVLETLMARWFSHAQRGGPEADRAGAPTPVAA